MASDLEMSDFWYEDCQWRTEAVENQCAHDLLNKEEAVISTPHKLLVFLALLICLIHYLVCKVAQAYSSQPNIT